MLDVPPVAKAEVKVPENAPLMLSEIQNPASEMDQQRPHLAMGSHPPQHCSSPSEPAMSLRSRELAGMGVFLPLLGVWPE